MIHNLLYCFLPFIIMLSVLVFVHELGHYLFAIKYGVKVDEFSIGMGPEIFGRTDKNGTRWKFSAIPFGGYVMMHGDKDAASTPNEEELRAMDRTEFNQTLFGKTPTERIIVSAAGPLANILYGILVFLLVYVFCGKPVNTNIIDKVNKNYPAAQFDIRQGDILTEINGEPINIARDVAVAMSKINPEKNVEILLVRDNVPLDKIAIKLADKKILGLSFKMEYQKISFFNAIWKSVVDCGTMFFMVLIGFAQIALGMISLSNIGGPISIAGAIGDIAYAGDIIYIVFFSAILSLNLAAVNLFPLPALDGGNIFFDTLELLGIKIKTSIREKITGGFFLILISLMVFTVYNDVIKIQFVQNLFR